MSAAETQAFFLRLQQRAKELCSDYPFDDATDTPFTYLWAITESLVGTTKACDDLHAVIKHLRPDLYPEDVANWTGEAKDAWLANVKQLYLDAGVKH